MPDPTPAEPERPLTLSADEVLALLRDGQATIRRPIDPQPYADHVGGEPMWGHRDVCGLFAEHVFGACFVKFVECPHGRTGETVWVRETWIIGYAAFAEEGRWTALRPTGWKEQDGKVFYRAGFIEPEPHLYGTMPWRPALAMPSWASRATARITAVEVEQVESTWFWSISLAKENPA